MLGKFNRRSINNFRRFNHKVINMEGISSVYDSKKRRSTESPTESSASEISSNSDVKEVKITKRLRKKNLGSGELRDSVGFKLKMQDSGTASHRQVDPEYDVEIKGNLRIVLPYYFTYKTFCKLRWRDRKLLDVFVDEFRDRDPSYYKKVISSGGVLLNGNPSTLDTVVRNGDLITHKLHRHEPAVSAKPIKTVYEDENILVIDKPSGVPVHPTGRYRFNTITKILQRQLGYVVHPCNRLDRLTSGLMFLAKTPRGADAMADQMKAREVRKEYVARVVGEFPVHEITVDKPLKIVEPKLGLNATCEPEEEGAKEAKTRFQRISYDGETSIVKCQPYTGRTHQIRVHLQHLGFPIANDPIYSNPQVWGPTLGKGCVADYDQVVSRLNMVGKTKSAESWYYPNSEGEVLMGAKCPSCEGELYTNPGPNDLDLWLHAYRYESTEFDKEGAKKWSYCTEFPDWAIESHKKYMEMAIAEAKKCTPVKSAFSVGAVLVNGLEVLSTGYSRELPGNTHAEQNALEKYFNRTKESQVPPGTILYTTMEPCSHRLSGNEPCVQRIIDQQRNIATVFVGLMEPDNFVKHNKSKVLLAKHDIEYVRIPGYEDECSRVALEGL
ncbi:HGL212Wp [Eremothecium sinecaudum]|uniref:tRNA pseudouridine(32) synthase n=1 Tax=Eremothecium sinecaudum TaxID=45286 RepID=A0A120K2N7_9SACH|nr:HGL212Wp [Eremothecium sinecaudum]AMD22128.1 HGL212Wp [Eremothecium sinecaudum]